MGYAPISRIAVPPSPASSGTTLSVIADSGDRFPEPPFLALVWPNQRIPDLGVNAEEPIVISIDGDNFIITRGDTPISITAGLQIAALSVTDVFHPGDDIVLTFPLELSDTPFSLHIGMPDGMLDVVTSLGVPEGTVNFTEGGLYHYYFGGSSGHRSPEQDFFIMYSEVDE